MSRARLFPTVLILALVLSATALAQGGGGGAGGAGNSGGWRRRRCKQRGRVERHFERDGQSGKFEHDGQQHQYGVRQHGFQLWSQ
jgi:hypothetical protein